jgi:hypothetical protein
MKKDLLCLNHVNVELLQLISDTFLFFIYFENKIEYISLHYNTIIMDLGAISL